MRLLVALSLLTLALAGCTAPVEEPDPLFGACPQWLDGPNLQTTLSTEDAAFLRANHTIPHFDGNLSLDLYRIVLTDLDVTGVVELRVYTEDGDQPMRITDYRGAHDPRTPTFITLDADSGDLDVDVHLTDVTQGADPAPADLRLELTAVDNGTASATVTATPGYRVCGAVF